MGRKLTPLIIVALAACMDITPLPTALPEPEATETTSYAGLDAVRVYRERLAREIANLETLTLNAEIQGQTVEERRKKVMTTIRALEVEEAMFASSGADTVPCDPTAFIDYADISLEYETEPIFPGLPRLGRAMSYTQSKGASKTLNSGGAIHRVYVYGEGGGGLYPGSPHYGEGDDRAEADETSTGCEKHWAVITPSFLIRADDDDCFWVYGESMNQIKLQNGDKETWYLDGLYESCNERGGGGGPVI